MVWSVYTHDARIKHSRLCWNLRIEYKLLSLTYKVLTASQPDYLHNLISVQSAGRTRSSFLVTLARPSVSSLTQSVVPTQWKTSIITPVPKVKSPLTCSDYRPISIIPILARLMEKLVVRDFLYPTLVHPDQSHLFTISSPFVQLDRPLRQFFKFWPSFSSLMTMSMSSPLISQRLLIESGTIVLPVSVQT